jgi:hypothetical protein
MGWDIIDLDKPDGEMGHGNVDLYKQDLASVAISQATSKSDVVHGLSTAHEIYENCEGQLANSRFHLSYLVVFEWSVRPGEGPPVPPPPEPIDVVQLVRNAAWNETGVDWFPDAAFYRKAKELGLGRPVTQETRLEFQDPFPADVGIIRLAWQAFDGGILWCVEGDWANIEEIDWL